MTAPTKVLLVAGARPNFMKVAPLIRAMRSGDRDGAANGSSFTCRLVHTGQHYDAAMSGIFFQELGIPAPDVNLEVGSGSHAAQTALIISRFEPVLEAERPDWLLVVGDVNSTMACSLVAAKTGVPIAHLEAGLRSGDRTMPEEINRLVTDAIADLLLTPSADADENLRREGVPAGKVRCVGNIMIDSLVANLPRAWASRVLAELGLRPGNFAYVTLHRPAKVDAAATLGPIMGALERLARQMPVVFPVHPRTRARLARFGLRADQMPGMNLTPPLGYHDSLCLTENARVVLTDSGGLQEESTWFRTPCLTLRPNTERPVTLTVGSNRLTTLGTLEADLASTLAGGARRGQIPRFWDGGTAGRVLVALAEASRNRVGTPGSEAGPAA